MAQQKVQLRKIRDFSENISDTFQFLKQEFKPLMTGFILVGGSFALVSAILTGIYQKQAFGFLDQFEKGIFQQQEFYDIYTPGYFFSVLFSIVAFSATITVIAVYMKFYDDTGASPTASDIWRSFGRYFPRAAIFSIIQTILILVGALLCFFPGVYLAIVFLPYPFIIVSEDKSIGATFSRCFDIIKEHFWESFGIYIVAGLISGVSSAIVGLVLGAIVGFGSYFSIREVGTSAAIATAVVSVIERLFYVIFIISLGLHYYNLSELREGTGLERRIENLGGNVNSNPGSEEQY